MNNFVFAILGISLIIVGIRICSDPIFYNSMCATVTDFTGFNTPLGLSYIAVGVLALWSVVKKKK